MNRREWLPSLIVLAVAFALTGWPAFFEPAARAFGSPCSEAPGHFWSLRAAADNFWRTGGFVRVVDAAWPDGFAEHLMDPVNLVAYLPPYWLLGGTQRAATVAWNAVHVFALLVGGLGAWLLARRLLEPGPARGLAAAVLVAAVVANPYFLHYPDTGRSEYVPALFYPLHLALLHRALREGTWRTAAAAGAVLGGVALGGWYLAVFVLIQQIPIALAFAAGQPWRRSLARLSIAAGVALLMLVPAFLALLAYPPRGLRVDVVQASAFAGIDVQFALRDLLRLGPPIEPGPIELPGYAGVVLMGLAALGAALRPRRALGWLVLGGVVALSTLGDHLEWTRPANPGAATGPRLLPWYLEALVPQVSNISSWARMGCLVTLPFGVAALHGFAALARRLPAVAGQLAIVALALVTVDAATYPSAWRPAWRSFDPYPPDGAVEVIAALPPGPIVQYPLDIPYGSGRCEFHSFLLDWQPVHGRPITVSLPPVFDMTLERYTLSDLARQAQTSWVLGGRRGDPAELSPEELAAARASVEAMREDGLAGIVFYTGLAESPALAGLLPAVLGEPDLAEGEVVAWSLAEVGDAPP